MFQIKRKCKNDAFVIRSWESNSALCTPVQIVGLELSRGQKPFGCDHRVCIMKSKIRMGGGVVTPIAKLCVLALPTVK